MSKQYQQIQGTGTISMLEKPWMKIEVSYPHPWNDSDILGFEFTTQLVGEQTKWLATKPIKLNSRVAFTGYLIPTKENRVPEKDGIPVFVMGLRKLEVIAPQSAGKDLLDWTVIGKLSKDPGVSPTGKAMFFTVPINVYMGKDEESRTIWYNISLLGSKKVNKALDDYLIKGSFVTFTGGWITTDEVSRGPVKHETYGAQYSFVAGDYFYSEPGEGSSSSSFDNDGDDDIPF